MGRALELSDWAVRWFTRPLFVEWVERLGRASAISQGPRNAAQVALTFDDGPHPRWTPLVLDALDRIGARATFFVVGERAQRFRELVREAHLRGHEIATHLYSHERDVVLDGARFDDELRRSRDELEELIGEKIRWLRFPYGARGKQSPRQIAERYGMRAVHWTFSSNDSRAREPEPVVRRIRAGLRAGAIVLLHDALADEDTLEPPYVAPRGATVAALPAIGALCEERGLGAVSLSELFGAS
jgi:peptidoglycan/xylan/chitin deacetylase (PgdA/CDA1 family)